MTRLSKFQIWVIMTLLGLGGILIATNIVAVVFISLGSTFIFLGLVLLFLECGPYMYYWWIPFRMGCIVKISHKEYMQSHDDIKEWLVENVKFDFLYRNEANEYYFLRDSDATGFKLRWI